jgi:hypothetical protein
LFLSVHRNPDNEVEDGAASNVDSEVAAKTEVPATEAQTAETTAPVVTETKEAEKAAEKIKEPLKQEAKVEAPLTEESTLQAVVDKTQASKAGQLPDLDTEAEGKGKH